MKKQSQLTSFLSVLALLGAFILIIFVLVPKIRQLSDLSNQAKAKSEQIELKKQEIAAVRQASALIKSAKQEVQTLQIAVPDKEKTEEALAQLSDATASAGLDLTSIGLHGAQDGYVKVSATVFGPFDKVIALMGNLEKNLRPIRVDDYTVTSSEGSADVSTTLNLSFPYLPQAVASVSASPQANASQESTINEK